MEKWFVRNKGADFTEWANALGVDPAIARLMRNRGILSMEEARDYLYAGMEKCHSPWQLKDMDLAVGHLLQAVKEGKKIRVIGDYDVDGICSSYILVSGIEKLGGNVDVAIPHRIHDGYGLNDHLIRKAAEDGVALIITCDNGISAKDQINLAAGMGMEVIVTDHHEVPYEMDGDRRVEILPEALAVVDPKRNDDDYPFDGICGGVVAYKFIQAVREKLAKEGMDTAALAEGLEEYLEFAAFATVCDVMELRDENRIIVKEGLKRMRQTKNMGIRALLNVCNIAQRDLSATHFGFVLGPCLNATGRLDNAQKALELLRCKDYDLAVKLAGELKAMNDGRKNLTVDGVKLANEMIERNGMEKDKVLVIYLPEVHESLAGIIAGRLKEQYGHPAIVLTKAEDGGIKGSGRSVEQYHLYEALVSVKHLLGKFGGHKLAAGLSLEEANVEELRKELNENCKLSEEDFIPRVYFDMEMPISYPTLSFVEQLSLLEPIGNGNSKPLFVVRDICFLSANRMGKEGQYGRFQISAADGTRSNMVYFGNMDSFLQYLDEKFGEGSSTKLLTGKEKYTLNIGYQLSINEYMQRKDVQIQMKYFQ